MKNFEKWNEEMFRKHATTDRYEEQINPVLRMLSTIRMKQIIRLVNAQPHEHILEVGCGSGQIIRRINKGKVLGIDYSSTAVSMAKRNTKDKEYVTVMKMDAQKINLPSNKFDKIICAEVLEHLEHPAKVLQGIRRIAKPGAKVILSFPNDRVLDKIRVILIKTGIFDILFKGADKHMEWHIQKFTPKSFRKLLERNGLKVKRTYLSPPLVWPPYSYIVTATVEK